MPIKWITEVNCQDARGEKKPVKVGDKVDLLPVNIPRHPKEDVTSERGRAGRARNFDFMLEWLGKGPYTVTNIGLWPCGGVNLYVECPNSPEAGASVREFMRVD